MLTFGLLVQLVAEIMAGDTTGIPVYVALNQPYPQIYVDGILDDSAWDNIQHTKSFYNNSPDKLFKSIDRSPSIQISKFVNFIVVSKVPPLITS